MNDPVNDFIDNAMKNMQHRTLMPTEEQPPIFLVGPNAQTRFIVVTTGNVFVCDSDEQFMISFRRTIPVYELMPGHILSFFTKSYRVLSVYDVETDQILNDDDYSKVLNITKNGFTKISKYLHEHDIEPDISIHNGHRNDDYKSTESLVFLCPDLYIHLGMYVTRYGVVIICSHAIKCGISVDFIPGPFSSGDVIRDADKLESSIEQVFTNIVSMISAK